MNDQRNKSVGGAVVGERMAVELDELAAFEEWFYSIPEHAHWSCLTPAYALASKAWQARAARAPLRDAGAAAGAGEPVAWRHRSKVADDCGGPDYWTDWRHQAHEPRGPQSDTFEYQPLYASPPQMEKPDGGGE